MDKKQAIIMILVCALAVGIGLVAMNWMTRDAPSQEPREAPGTTDSQPIAVDPESPGDPGTVGSGAEDDEAGPEPAP